MKMILKTLAAAAMLAALTAGSAAAMDLPAPTPEFRSPEELQAEAASRAAASQQPTAERTEINTFYTGKPQDRESGAHIFLFRNYDPELSRWTARDPSGFPDGANENTYAPSPTYEIDYAGLIALSVTAPSVATVQAPNGSSFVEAWTIQAHAAGGGMQNTLAQLVATHFTSLNLTISQTAYAGNVDVQQYRALGTDRHGRSNGTIELQVILSGAPSDFTWVQIARLKSGGSASWGHWFVDSTGFGAPSYNVSDDPRLYDLPTIGAWNQIGASKEFYTFAASKTGNDLTVYDGFYWGGAIKE